MDWLLWFHLTQLFVFFLLVVWFIFRTESFSCLLDLSAKFSKPPR